MESKTGFQGNKITNGMLSCNHCIESPFCAVYNNTHTAQHSHKTMFVTRSSLQAIYDQVEQIHTITAAAITLGKCYMHANPNDKTNND